MLLWRIKKEYFGYGLQAHRIKLILEEVLFIIMTIIHGIEK